MRRMALALAALAAIFLVSMVLADACGDKSLRIGRGIRFQRLSRAGVLIYIPSDSTRANQLQSMLKKVVHKSYTVQSADTFREALKSGQYDLVLADLEVAASVENQIGTSPTKPVLVAVVSEGTKAEVSAAKKQYKYVVKNPHNADNYLDAIEDVMRSRVHLLAKKGSPT